MYHILVRPQGRIKLTSVFYLLAWQNPWYFSVTASCGVEIYNNVTYFVSPDFPALTQEMGECIIRVKKLSSDISQFRFDLGHFQLVSNVKPLNYMHLVWNSLQCRNNNNFLIVLRGAKIMSRFWRGRKRSVTASHA